MNGFFVDVAAFGAQADGKTGRNCYKIDAELNEAHNN